MQNHSGDRWTEESVNQRLDAVLEREARRVLDRAEEENISYRKAAYRQGIERIAGAIRERGNNQDGE
ncbi:hypothetical protein [Halomonas salipaludis]|uniref:hypothetical protein n=1 Tax=Halomonas salipaludis TaxID=2032625 RepID=UPI001594FD61|nr:hypothetical protein [Halomonas salipaludis]